MSTYRLRRTGSWLLSLLTTLPLLALAAEPVLPSQQQNGKFLGVETCGSAQCHGSPEPWRNATVMMKERLIWEGRDKHARAFASLKSPEGQRIAHNLGLKDATGAPECLSCHTTYAPPAQRGARFSLESGVTCESCHGVGSSFLKAHMQPTATHESNVEHGMYPTTDPAARGRLCLSCHQGDENHKISHSIYGAGHPRLRFELDTYSINQPYHFNVDADYRRRKAHPAHFRFWAEGQLMAARMQLEMFSDQTRMASGLLPELAAFDCHSCHQAMRASEARGGQRGNRSGTPALNDAPLVVLRALADVVSPPLAERLAARTRDLQAATTQAQRNAAITALRGTLEELSGALAKHGDQSGDGPAAARALAGVIAKEHGLPYASAEASAMAFSTLLIAEHEAGRMTDERYQRVNKALDAIYAALGSEWAYRPAELTSAVAHLDQALAAP